MAVLKFVRESKDSSLLSLGIIEGEESARYTVNAAVYAEIGAPEAGELLSEEQMSLIKHADEMHRAMKKALSLLSFADNNERTLRQKLIRAGFNKDISEWVCREMVRLGYVNEKRQLERLILNEANIKLRGPGRIIPTLSAKGYSSSDIREVMHRLAESGELDFKKNARLLIDKKLPGADAEEKRKLLYKNGYKIC
nr:hypothetical protein [Oscillospiraceae bacterium]